MKQRFKADDFVTFKHTMFSPQVWWIVVNPQPDAIGQIVIKGNRSNEYVVAYEADLRRL